ncbi:hypothetical protein DLE60_28895 [Micromonospora globispora]|uniref:SMI1/KNR4 family protein n=1 Tax=Micromonospora globispora TaxID=1450148 RepID=A0A317JWA5_9ACTN|nr:hypothetical protein DLJ46_22880 [Micromonospora globispora]PWU55085.1 hypothetical protein DLE60_28895 [Micromonospora globispora]RQW83045.1 hypothetical protein DKL51_32155 [Micromonospora globispora]
MIWREDLREAVASAVLDFEDSYGYPPGANTVSGPDTTATALIAAVRPAIPAALVELYAAVGAVDLPDIGNGFFLRRASDVAHAHEARDLWHVRGCHDADVVVFASDGGGTQYALATPAGSPVYRLPPDLVLDGIYTSEDPRFDVAAPDLSTFLDRLFQAVKMFAASSTPPSL